MPRPAKLTQDTTTSIFIDFIKQHADFQDPERRAVLGALISELEKAGRPGTIIRVGLSVETIEDERERRAAMIETLVPLLRDKEVTELLCQDVTTHPDFTFRRITKNRQQLFRLEHRFGDIICLAEGSTLTVGQAILIASIAVRLSYSRTKEIYYKRKNH